MHLHIVPLNYSLKLQQKELIWILLGRQGCTDFDQRFIPGLNKIAALLPSKLGMSPIRSAENSSLSVGMAEDTEVGVGGDDEQIEEPSKSPVDTAFKAPIRSPFHPPWGSKQLILMLSTSASTRSSEIMA